MDCIRVCSGEGVHTGGTPPTVRSRWRSAIQTANFNRDKGNLKPKQEGCRYIERDFGGLNLFLRFQNITILCENRAIEIGLYLFHTLPARVSMASTIDKSSNCIAVVCMVKLADGKKVEAKALKHGTPNTRILMTIVRDEPEVAR